MQFFTKLKTMKASNAAGELDAREINDLLIDFTISIVDVDYDIRQLQERVANLEDVNLRMSKAFLRRR